MDITVPNPEAAWDSPDNLRYVIDGELATPFCLGDLDDDHCAHVFGVTGPDSAFDPLIVSRYVELPPDIITVIEVRDSKTQCFQPGDYNVTDLLSYTGRIGDHLHGLLDDRLHVLFADGEVWALSPDAPMTALHPFLTITGAEANDRDKLLAPHRVR